MEITISDEDPFEKVLMEMVTLNRKKRADYAGDEWWTQNFYDTAYQNNDTAGRACEFLISTKQSRLRVLSQPGRSPKNESIRDTILDRAVYSSIALGLYDEGGYNHGPLTVTEPE